MTGVDRGARHLRCAPKARLGLIVLAVACVTAVVSGPAVAQGGPSGVLGGFSRDNGPINIEADTLTINDQTKVATYKGNVVAVQGANTLRTVELEVQYVSREDEGKGQTPGAPTKATAKGAPQPAAKAGPKPGPKTGKAAALGEEGQQIKRIKAKQKVVMVSAPAGKEAQSATSDTADYDVASQLVELRGNVFIKQGENVTCGSKVKMNLATSEYTVERDPTAPPPTNPECGRVRGVFFPQKKTADAPGAKGKAAPATPATGTTPAAAATPPAADAKQPASSSWTATTSPAR